MPASLPSRKPRLRGFLAVRSTTFGALLLAAACTGDSFLPSPSGGGSGGTAGSTPSAGAAGAAGAAGDGGSGQGGMGGDPLIGGQGGTSGGEAGSSGGDGGTGSGAGGDQAGGSSGAAGGQAGSDPGGAAGAGDAGSAGQAGNAGNAGSAGNAGQGGSDGCVASSPQPGTIFVSSDGSAAGDGSSLLPYASLSAALAAAAKLPAGDVRIAVATGTVPPDGATAVVPSDHETIIEGGWKKTGGTWVRDCEAQRDTTLVLLGAALGIDAKSALTLRRLTLVQQLAPKPTATGTPGTSAILITTNRRLDLTDVELRAAAGATAGPASPALPAAPVNAQCSFLPGQCGMGTAGTPGIEPAKSTGWTLSGAGFQPGNGANGEPGSSGSAGVPGEVEAKMGPCATGCSATGLCKYDPGGGGPVIAEAGTCGCGGFGSPGGQAGLGGGASIAVLATGDRVRLVRSRVVASTGGNGTEGSNASEGGVGTKGKSGKVHGGHSDAGCCLLAKEGCNGDVTACYFNARPNGPGGIAACDPTDTLPPRAAGTAGGKGGVGSKGSAGVGGPSIAIAHAAGTDIQKSNGSELVVAQSGAAPGSPAVNGTADFTLK